MSSSPRSSIRRWWLAIIAMAAAVPLALCGPAVAGGGGGDHGGGDAAHPDNGKHKGHTKSHSNNGKHKGHTKSRSDSGKHKGHAKSNGKSNGKTTICHATGSSTNPYVTITISNNALAAHRRHQDGRDIIPAPTGGCPKGGTAPTTQSGGKDKDNGKGHAKGKDNDNGKAKVTICHATGSETNPYVEITISESAVKAHDRHQNGEDIIPAPATGCPAPAARAPARTESGVLGQTFSGGAPTALAPAAAPAPAAQVAPRAGSAPQDDGIQVLGETASGIGSETAAGDTVDAAAATTGSLPFTGIDLVLIALAALGCLLAGVALKRALGGRPA